MKNDKPLEVAENIRKKLFADANVVFAAGSIFRGEGTPFSDIDLIILYDERDDVDVRRQTLMSEGWPIEIFVHTPKAQDFFFDQDRKSGSPATLSMVMEGHELPLQSELSQARKKLANRLYIEGPNILTAEEIDKRRYFISDAMDDLRGVSEKNEQTIILSKLFEDLADFHLRAQGKWSGKGKGLVRALRKHSPDMAEKFLPIFIESFASGRKDDVLELAETVLLPYGGTLLEFSSSAGDRWRSFSK